MMSSSKDGRMAFETGAGYLDVAAALNATGVAESALSPLAVVQPDGSVTFDDTALTWGDVWGQGLVWGGGRSRATMTSTENDQVTASGLVWGGGRSCHVGAFGTLETLGLVWGGGRR
jgi:hypothetical protein